MAVPAAVTTQRRVRGRLPIPVEVESQGEDQCAFEPGSDHPEMLALYLGMLDADFTTWTRRSWWTRCAS